MTQKQRNYAQEKKRKHKHVWPLVTYMPNEANCLICGLNYWMWPDNAFAQREKEINKQKRIFEKYEK